MTIDFRIIAAHQEVDNGLQAHLTSPDYSIENVHGPDLIFYMNRIAIPETLFDRIIIWYHELLNHPGVDMIYLTINQHFYGRGLEARVRNLIRRCSCQKNKRVTRSYGHVPPTYQHDEPWECVQADLFGPWSYTDVNGIDRTIIAVSFIDIATRWIGLHDYSSKN